MPKRKLAFLIDFIIVFLTAFICAFIDGVFGWNTVLAEMLFVFGFIVGVFGYFITIPILFKRTFGMMVLGLQIVRTDGKPLSTWDIIVVCSVGVSYSFLISKVLSFFFSGSGQNIAEIFANTDVVSE